jgi:glucosylceramidase
MAWLRHRTLTRALVISGAVACVALVLVWPRPAGASPPPRAFAASPAGAVAARTAQDVEVVQTAADLSQHLQRLPDLKFSTQAPRHMPVIHVNDDVRYQRVHGVGAAMTDTSAWLIYDQLSPGARYQLMYNLFGLNGINLNFTLVPIGATDFTVGGKPYSYDDEPPGQADPQLQDFSVAHDASYVIPALRQMLQINPQTEIFAVPWSPPAWMKANQALHNVAHRGLLLPSAYGPLAQYFVKFIQSYAARGIPIAAIAPENEPHAPAPFPGMELPEPIEAQWITQYLRPALRAAHLSPRVYGGDTAWKNPSYPNALLSGPARGAINGIAWHCYNGIPYVISAAHAKAPNLDHTVTECSPGISPYPVPEVIIGSMRNWARTVTLWNVALDPSGGPVQSPNTGCQHCTGLVTIDESNHQVTYNLPYYQLGQLGRFVQPGAARIDTEHFVRYYHTSAGVNGATEGLDDAAFLNPDGSRVVLAYNNSPAPITFGVTWHGSSFTYTLPAGATVTFAWDRSAVAGQAAAGVNPANEHQYVFWQGADGYLQEAWRVGPEWTGPVKLSAWGKTASAPSAAIGENSNQYVVWEATNGHILEAWYQRSHWTGPQDMTRTHRWGKATAAPAIAVNPRTYRQYVFWRGTDRRIHHAWFNGRWHRPVAMGWPSSSAPSVAVDDASHQYVFWEAAGGHIEEAWYGTHWNGPVDMTRTYHWPRVTTAPAVAVNPSTSHQYVFWRDSAGHILQALSRDGRWLSPLDLTRRYALGETLSAPGAAVADDYSQYLFWRATAGNIREGSYQGRWHLADLNWR